MPAVGKAAVGHWVAAPWNGVRTDGNRQGAGSARFVTVRREFRDGAVGDDSVPPPQADAMSAPAQMKATT